MTERAKIIKLLLDSMRMRIARRATDDIDILGIPDICGEVLNCIGSIEYEHETLSGPFAVKVVSKSAASSDSIFIPATLADFISTHTNDVSNVIVVNYQGHFIGTEKKVLLTAGDVSEYSESNGLVFFVSARQISAVVSGRTVDHIPNASSYKPTLTVRGDEMAIDEWKKILKKYEMEIKGQKRFFYWATPKTKGLLLDAPEKLFRKDLAKFIEENTLDCGVDEEAYNDNSTDRVDIRVTTSLDNNVYYFELKCLGECESGTVNAEDHAQSGLVQVNIYVINDPKSKEGILVVFDGRAMQADIKWPDAIVKKLDKRVKLPPTVMRLDRHSASEKSKAEIKELKKKN